MVFQIKQREAYIQGREEGLAEGIGIGREEGIGIGIDKGIGIGEANVLRKMHMKGMSVDQLADMCEIPAADIEAMLAQKDARKPESQPHGDDE